MDIRRELRRGKNKQKSEEESFKKEKVIFLDCKGHTREGLSRVYSFSNRVTVNLDESYFGGMMDAENRLHGTAECMGGHNLEKARCGSFFYRRMNKIVLINRKKNPRCSDNPEKGTRFQKRIRKETVGKEERNKRKRKKKRSHKTKDDGGGGGGGGGDDYVIVTIYQALSLCQALCSGLYGLYEADQYVHVIQQKTDSKQAERQDMSELGLKCWQG